MRFRNSNPQQQKGRGRRRGLGRGTRHRSGAFVTSSVVGGGGGENSTGMNGNNNNHNNHGTTVSTNNNQFNLSAAAVAAAVGRERLKSDLRQLGGLLLILSFAVTVAPLASIVANIPPTNSNKTSSSSSSEGILQLVASFCECIVGMYGMLIGMFILFCDRGNKFITLSLMIVIQLAWIPFILHLLNTIYGCLGTPSSNPFIPVPLSSSSSTNGDNNNNNYYYKNVTTNDVMFIGAMGVLSIIVYAFTMYGSIAFITFSIFMYQINKPQTRSATYYRGRAWFYDGLIIFGGFSQMSLGSYLLNRFGNFRNFPQFAPIQTGMYVVYLPELTVFVGVLQCMYGLYGYSRASSIVKFKRDLKFQICSFGIWFVMITCQCIVQLSWEDSIVISLPPSSPSYTNGDSGATTTTIHNTTYKAGVLPFHRLASLAPTFACIYLGFVLIPAFLDVRIDVIPEEIKPEYYGEIEFLYDDPINDVSTRYDARFDDGTNTRGDDGGTTIINDGEDTEGVLGGGGGDEDTDTTGLNYVSPQDFHRSNHHHSSNSNGHNNNNHTNQNNNGNDVELVGGFERVQQRYSNNA